MMTKRLMVKIVRSRKAGSNAGDWLSFIQGVETESEKSSLPIENPFTPLFDFIEHRCDTELNLKLVARKKVKAGELKPTDLNAWQCMQSLWTNSPGFSAQINENFEQKLRLNNQQKDLTEQQTLAFIESYCYLCFDFYLEAITHFEVGFSFYSGKNKEKYENDLGNLRSA